MNKDDQRVAIAQACGWVILTDNRLEGYKPVIKGIQLPEKNPLMERDASYHTGDYCRILMQVTSGGSVENMTQYNLLHATAAPENQGEGA